MVLINASNLHGGGGLQVATSVICEIASRRDVEGPLNLYVSSAVERNLDTRLLRAASHVSYEAVDVRGLRWNLTARHGMDAFSTVFTLFGPLYRWWTPFRSIVGFAQAWIIYPNNECYQRMPFFERLKTRLKFWVQAQFFKRADILVVELEHVKEGLVRELGFPADRIHVVHNCLSSLYGDEALWQDVAMPEPDGHLRLGFVGRNYSHKNTGIFPEVAAILRQVHGINARFYVTFTDDEWRSCSPEFREACINIGPLAVAQCPSFYRGVDAVVFPSLLECFSATPLEAMAMEKPLFASDRPFNRDICDQHAHYFDPLSAASAAEAIARVFVKGGPDASALSAARDHAFGFSSAPERAQKYLALLTSNA